MHLGPKILLNFCGGLEKFPPLKNYHEVAKYRLCEPPSVFSPLVGCHGCWPTRWRLRETCPHRGVPALAGNEWMAHGKRHLSYLSFFFLRHKYSGACIGRERQKYDYGASSSGVIVGCFETYGAFASFHHPAAPTVLTLS